MKFLKSESKPESGKKIKGIKKDQLLIALLLGILLVVIAIPSEPQKKAEENGGTQEGESGQEGKGMESLNTAGADSADLLRRPMSSGRSGGSRKSCAWWKGWET